MANIAALLRIGKQVRESAAVSMLYIVSIKIIPIALLLCKLVLIRFFSSPKQNTNPLKILKSSEIIENETIPNALYFETGQTSILSIMNLKLLVGKVFILTVCNSHISGVFFSGRLKEIRETEIRQVDVLWVKRSSTNSWCQTFMLQLNTCHSFQQPTV